MTFHSVQGGRGEDGTCVDTRSNDDRYLMEIDSAWVSHWWRRKAVRNSGGGKNMFLTGN